MFKVDYANLLEFITIANNTLSHSVFNNSAFFAEISS